MIQDLKLSKLERADFLSTIDNEKQKVATLQKKLDAANKKEEKRPSFTVAQATELENLRSDQQIAAKKQVATLFVFHSWWYRQNYSIAIWIRLQAK